MTKCSRASAGLGVVGLCEIAEIIENTCLQKELRDLQNHRICTIVPVLPQELQHVVQCPG